ncbi:MAG: regulator of chromosome condensation 1/beta-lactamase-inhibitor protein II [Monoraphidium minutum]|nr:MAG: regulator of chromosome condensation 1/beta-lactamase-inhibitor protein II [Monoraphidium minutum]
MTRGSGAGAGAPPDCGEGPVGALCRALPSFARIPPVEAVVFAWGASEDHQLGLDAVANCSGPKVVEALLGLQLMGRGFPGTPLIAGSRNTLAIDSEGQLWSLGWNDRGTLGHGHREKERKPRRVHGLKGVRIVQAAIGGWHCLALSEEGQVYAWGGNEYNQCGLQDPSRDVLTPRPCMPQLRVRQVACGGMNSLVLTEGGDVWTWGEPWGDFSLEVSREPRKVEGAHDVAAIACGAFHSMALNGAGEVFSWGTNDYGQLGNGSTCYSTVPEKVVDLDGIPVADVAAGGWHSLALTSGGEVYVWGRGEYGRLGVGDRTGSSKLRPHPVRGLEAFTIVQVAAGGTHSMALTSTGRTFIWGRASYGRLGLGDGARDHYSPIELALPGGHERWRVAAITCGGRHSMCLAVPLRDAPGGGEGEAAEAAPQQRGRTGGGGGGGPQVQFEDAGGGRAAGPQQPPPRPPSAAGVPPPVSPLSPLRRPASSGGAGFSAAAANGAANGGGGDGGAAPALAALSLSRAGSRSLDVAAAATLAQVRALSPGRPAGAAAAAAPGSPLAAVARALVPASPVSLVPLSPSHRGGRIFGLSGALSEVPAEDALPLSGDEESEAEALAQAEVDRRHGTGEGSVHSGAAAAGGAGDGASGPQGEGGGGEGGGDGGGFGRVESIASMPSASSLGSPLATGPGGTYNHSAERTSMHHLAHLS